MRKPLPAIDGLRAIAVLGVVMYHFIGAQSIAGGHEPPMWANVGARGVDLFFVISGFCLAYPYVGPIATRSRPLLYGAFLLRRFVRLAPPYYIALTLFALLALSPFGVPTRVDGAPHSFPPAAEYFLDLAFMPPPDPVFNDVFWSLGVEMRWYLLCPLLITLYNHSRISFSALIVGLYALVWLLKFHVTDLGTLPAFMLGIVAADVVSLGIPRDKRWCLVAFAFAALILAIAQQAWDPGVDHAAPLWHVAGFALVIAVASPPYARAMAVAPLGVIGAASYSVYLVHAPILRFLGAHGLAYPIAAALSIAIGLGFWRVVEAPLLEGGRRSAMEGFLRDRASWIFSRTFRADRPQPLELHATLRRAANADEK